MRSRWELPWCLPSLSTTLSRAQHTALFPPLPRTSQLTLLLFLCLFSFSLTHIHILGKCVHMYIAKRARSGAFLNDSVCRSGCCGCGMTTMTSTTTKRTLINARLAVYTSTHLHIHLHMCVYLSWLCSIVYIATGKLPGLGPNPNAGKPVRLCHTELGSHTHAHTHRCIPIKCTNVYIYNIQMYLWRNLCLRRSGRFAVMLSVRFVKWAR